MSRFSALSSIALTLFVFAGFANADTIQFRFDATLDTGPLAGTTFPGTGSYDNQGETGIGQEYFSLTSLDFTLLGASFTRAGIDQGGQAILNDGVMFTFTAAFFPPPPTTSVTDIAFGFGGPGIIGYTVVGSSDIGSGSYTLTSVPEPAALNIALLGLVAVAAACFRSDKLRRRRGGAETYLCRVGTHADTNSLSVP